MKEKLLVKKRKTVSEIGFICAMLAWPLIHFCVFWVYVNANTFYLSFHRFNPAYGVYEWVGIDRFADILHGIFVNPDAQIINFIKNSLTVFPLKNFIMLPLSLVMAFFMSKKMPLSGMFRVIFFLPSILSVVVLALAFKYMFNPTFGPIDALIKKLFGKAPVWLDITDGLAMKMTFSFTVWTGLGYKMMLFQSAIQRIPPEIVESAKLDGVSLTREFFRITVPLVMSTVTTFFVLNTLEVFTYYLHPMLICGESGGANGITGTIALHVFGLTKRGYVEDAAAFGLFFSVVGIPFIFFIKRFLEKITPDVEF